MIILAAYAAAPAAQTFGQYALYQLGPSDLTAEDALRIASSQKLSPIQAAQNQLATLFEDRKQNVRMVYEAGTLKWIPDLAKYKKKAASEEEAIAAARAWLDANQLWPSGEPLQVDEVTTLSRQTGTSQGKLGKTTDALRSVSFVRQLDGLSVYGPSSILSVSVGKKGQVAGLDRSIRPLGSEPIPVQIKSLDQATQEFNQEYAAVLAASNPEATAETLSVDLVYFEQGQSFVQPAYLFLVQLSGPDGFQAGDAWFVAAALQTPEPIVNRPQVEGSEPAYPSPPLIALAAPGEVKYGRYVVRNDHGCWADDAKAFGTGISSTNAFRVAFSGFPAVKDEQFFWNYQYMWEACASPPCEEGATLDLSDTHVGAVDLALIEGHGLPWLITTDGGECNHCCRYAELTGICLERCGYSCIDLPQIDGYGGFNGRGGITDYVVWQGCSVIPAPGDAYGGRYATPATPFDVWFEIFKGMRGTYGYRTVMHICNGVGSAFGKDIGYGFPNLGAWLFETDNNYWFHHKGGLNYGSAVIVTGHENDRVYDTAPLPAPKSLTLWWMHA